jgi:hypothetical protein
MQDSVLSEIYVILLFVPTYAHSYKKLNMKFLYNEICMYCVLNKYVLHGCIYLHGLLQKRLILCMKMLHTSFSAFFFF